MNYGTLILKSSSFRGQKRPYVDRTLGDQGLRLNGNISRGFFYEISNCCVYVLNDNKMFLNWIEFTSSPSDITCNSIIWSTNSTDLHQKNTWKLHIICSSIGIFPNDRPVLRTVLPCHGICIKTLFCRQFVNVTHGHACAISYYGCVSYPLCPLKPMCLALLS